ncbi:MAG: LamG-like jellyroll fold domain-containing protein [Anaerolineales bacterium]
MIAKNRLKLQTLVPSIFLVVLCASCAPGFVVNSASDDFDINPGDGNCQTANNECTLRAAIMEGNAGGNGAIIEFENVSTITPATALPPLTAGGFRIEGGGKVTLDGEQPLACSGFRGLELRSSFNTIQGLTISNFGTGIYINGFFPTGEAKSNVIGLGPSSENTELEHNVLTGNCRGIYIRGQGAFGNTLAGNFIGTDGSGTVAMPNDYGIIMGNGAHHNLIGASAAGNLSPFNSQGLAAYWPMDEASGAALDSNGANFLNEKDGSLGSAAGIVNTGRDFELNDTEYFSRGDLPDLSTGDIDFTWSLWVKPESIGPNMWLVQKADTPTTAADYEYLLFVVANAGNAPRFRVGNGSAYANVTANTSLTAGSWYHIVAWHDSVNDEIGISVNGGAPVTQAYSSGGQDTSGNLVVGASLINNTPGNYFDGVIDEVGFWKRVLSPQEIAALYNIGNGLAYAEADPYRNVISGNSTGVLMDDSDFNHFTGNYIGTVLGGLALLPNTGSGIYMASSADNNVIGINQSGEGGGNLISGNGSDGIVIQDSHDNFVAGNLIGTNATGGEALGNGQSGIFIQDGPFANIIGTNGDGSGDAMEGNIISGNGQDICRPGIWLNSGLNIVAGNYIGTNSEGAPGLGNCRGIDIGVDGNRIGTNGDGTSDALEGNVISGNGGSGVTVSSAFNQISGNFIGTNPGGTLALGNGFAGIALSVASHDNLIGTNGDGTADVAERNIISGNAVNFNGFAGIDIAGDNNIIAGNYIGVNAAGSAGIPNMQYGIGLRGDATLNLIGTDGNGTSDAAEGNLISGNGWHGITVFGSLNRISGNLIGTNAGGTAAIPNGVTYDAGYGIGLNAGAVGNVIGTNGDGNGDAAERNIISGNARSAVSLYGTGTTNNVIAGNYIGTDITGASALPNGGIGVHITSGPSSNRIGTNGDGLADAAEANVISSNTSAGVFIIVAPSNQIAGNFIGTDKTGTQPLGNGADGIHINASNQGNTNGNVVGGSTAKANVIAYNQQDGVEVTGTGVYPLNTPILYNSIFLNSGLGINLRPGDLFYGITPNDSLDVDSGANNLMNFPVLSFALALNNAVNISGEMVDGLPNAAHLIQFFSSPSCDPSGNGEGQVYLGESNEMTNGSGDVSFLVNLNVTVQAGHFITATATNANNTSEFSACVEVVAGESFSQEIEGGFNITPLRNLNCRYYCTQQSDIADTLLEGVLYIPIGWDAVSGFFAFEGPSFGQLCFAPPQAGSTSLMSLSFNGQEISAEQLSTDMVETRTCPAFPTATPVPDEDEGSDATNTPASGNVPTATPTPRNTPVPSATPRPQCSDGMDNDGDGLVDYDPAGGGDPQCRNANDNCEAVP